MTSLRTPETTGDQEGHHKHRLANRDGVTLTGLRTFICLFLGAYLGARRHLRSFCAHGIEDKHFKI